MKPCWWRGALIALVLGLVFVAYLSPASQVTLANLWALCGF